MLNTTHKKFEVACESEQCVVIEPTANFAGFETRVDGARATYVDNGDIGGRIAYILGRGTHTVETRFTEKTWPRLVGDGISVLAVVAIIYMATRRR